MIDHTTVTWVVSFFTLVSHVAILVILVMWIGGKNPLDFFPKKLTENLLLLGALIAGLSMLGSLYYSVIVGYEVCSLCWWQRIFIYPQVFLLGFAWWRKEWSMSLYSIILSVIGLGFAVYHYFFQMFGTSFMPPCIAGGADCAKIHFIEFGYITFPMLGITTFLVLLVLMFLERKRVN